MADVVDGAAKRRARWRGQRRRRSARPAHASDEHPATSTDADQASNPHTGQASGPTRRSRPGAAAGCIRYRRVMHEHIVRATIDSGTVEGFTRDGVNRWRSIPYARPPVGRLRLRAPQPVQPWPGVRYCHGFGYCAPQQRMYTILAPGKYQPMSEDCLTLNVVTPKRPRDEPLPVMVFIHGGGYFMGSSATPIYDGAALARQGCVYVSVNYRLGALGCLDLSSLSNKDVTFDDNLFLRDLVMALRWVRDNIAVFGGDPDNVTIFGESAGAHAVATLLAVPAAKGLFAQAISESPAAGMVRTPESRPSTPPDSPRCSAPVRRTARPRVMAARPARSGERVRPADRQGQREMLGAFAAGPTSGHRVPAAGPGRGDACGQGAPRAAHRRHQRRGSPAVRPFPQAAADDRADDRATAGRRRNPVSANALPPPIRATRTLRPASSSAATSRSARPRGRSPRRTAATRRPTSTVTTTRRARLRWSGLGATHATELLAVFDVYRTKFGRLLTAAADRRSALRVSDDVQARWRTFSRPGCPARTGPLTPAPTVR